MQDIPIGFAYTDILQENGRQFESLPDFDHGGDGSQGYIVNIPLFGKSRRKREAKLTCLHDELVGFTRIYALADELT